MAKKAPIPKDRPRGKLKGKVPKKKTSAYSTSKEKRGLKAKGKQGKKLPLGVANIDAPDFGKWLDGYQKTGNNTMKRKKNGL